VTSDLFHVPAHSIAVFERIHGLRVTVHDLAGTLWPILLPDQFRHSRDECSAVKNSAAGQKCIEFEVDRLRGEIADLPNGRAHVCHAGYVEWVVPVFGERQLELVLFAGVRAPADDLACEVRPLRLPVLGPKSPLPVGEQESQQILEHLRQLAARLKQWTIDFRALGTGLTAAGPVSAAQRAMTIRRFVAQRHPHSVRLEDLADELGLTESRTSHVVRETCGRTFKQMLVEARLRTSMGLLRHSGMQVSEIAARSGFDDLRHFHRLFKRQTGQTPHRYRRTSE